MTAAASPLPLAAVIVAASLASTIGGLPFNALPLLLGSLAESFQLTPQAVGLMGSVCFGGYLLGTVGAPVWINRLDWRRLTVASAAAAALAFAASSQVREIPVLVVAWAAIGFFASTMTCLGLRVLSDLPNPVRAFGIRQGVELTVTAAVLFALPPLVIARWAYPGAALALAAVVVLLGLSARWVPRRPLAADAAAGPARRSGGLSGESLVALAVFFCFLVGNIGLWAFLERIGKAQAIAAAQMGIVFAVLKLLGGAAAFSVAGVGERVPGPWRFGAVALLAGLGLALLTWGTGFLGFALGAWVWEFAFTCGCIYLTAVIARHDTSGRAIVLVPAVFAASSMVGPGLAGQLAGDGRFDSVLLLAAASTVVPVLAYLGRRGARVAG